MSGNRLSRRHFSCGTPLAAAVLCGGFGRVPSLPAMGFKSCNDERSNTARVGMGNRGPRIRNGLAKTGNIVAVCDVDEADKCLRPFLRKGWEL